MGHLTGKVRESGTTSNGKKINEVGVNGVECGRYLLYSLNNGYFIHLHVSLNKRQPVHLFFWWGMIAGFAITQMLHAYCCDYRPVVLFFVSLSLYV